MTVNPMMTVFIGGSRRITRLSKAIQSRLDNIIDKGYKIPFFDKMNKMNRINKDHKSCKFC